MAKIKDKYKKIILNYSRDLEKKMPIQKVIVYGSVARGLESDDSDIDLIVISNSFAKMSFIRRLEYLSILRGRKYLDVPMDITGYTPEEFSKASKESVVLKEAAKEGIVVYPE